MGKTNPDKKRLGADVEDECKSIAWQVCPYKAQDAACSCLGMQGNCCGILNVIDGAPCVLGLWVHVGLHRYLAPIFRWMRWRRQWMLLRKT